MSKKKSRVKPKPTRRSKWWLTAGFVLFGLSLVAYWNSFHVPLVFDDMQTIQRNEGVRFGGFDRSLLFGRAFLYMSFTLNYLWSGQDVWSYHLVNFILHLINGILVLIVAERAFGIWGRRENMGSDPSRDEARLVPTGISQRKGSDPIFPLRPQIPAVLAALFFLVHPVQTESVTYISSRSELLSTFFYLAGLVTFILWPQHRIGFLCSLAVGVAYFLGLGSKETVITLPATIFLYDFLFMSNAQFRPILSRWRFYLTYIAGAAAVSYYFLVLDVSLRGSIGGNVAGNLPPWHYFLTELRVIVRYIRLLFFPVGLNLDYDFQPSTSPFEPAVIVSFLFLCGVVFLGWTLRRSFPVFTFSIFWFLITLSPTSSVIPIRDVIFEHRLYLPLIGVCFSFPFFVQFVYGNLRQRVAIRGSAFVYSCLLLAALVAGTIVRNYTWSDEVRLFQDVVSKSPNKDRPYNGLAWAHYKRAEFNQAIDVLQEGLVKVPQSIVQLHDTLGNLYLKVGRYDEAVELFKKTTGFLSGERLALAYNNVGVAYLYMWNDLQSRRAQLSPEEFVSRREQILKPAAEAFSKGLEVEPGMDWLVDSYVNVMCYRDRGNEVEAASLERLKQKETYEDLYSVGKVAFNRGDYAKADQYFERAEKVRDNVKVLFFNHGYALTELKQDDRAIEKYIQAVRLDPIFIEAQHNLGLLYMRRAKFDQAAEAFEEVLRQDPKHVSSNLNLASIYMSRGNKMAARSHLLTVLDASPGNERAAAMLAQLGS